MACPLFFSFTSLPLYFYNRLTGTRWLTCEEFANLGRLDDTALARQLQEIANYSIRRSHLGRPELDFFAVDLRHCGAALFAGVAFGQLAPPELRAKYEYLNNTSFPRCMRRSGGTIAPTKPGATADLDPFPGGQ